MISNGTVIHTHIRAETFLYAPKGLTEYSLLFAPPTGVCVVPHDREWEGVPGEYLNSFCADVLNTL